MRRACLYCNVVHVLGILICAVVFSGAWHSGNLRPPELSPVIAAAMIGLIILIAGQVFSTHRTFEMVPSSSEPDHSTQSISALAVKGRNGKTEEPNEHRITPMPLGEISLPPSSPSREIVLREREIAAGHVVMADAWGVRQQAAHVIAFAFDYTCLSCRSVHKMLEQAVRRSAGRLSVLLLPMPQHPACNRTTQKVGHGHAYACQYSRMALSLWMSHPHRFEEFDRFLSEGDATPPLGLATRQFEELTETAINPHVRDDRLDGIIEQAVEIYENFTVQKIPSLLLPDGDLHGVFESIEKLRSVLNQQVFQPAPVPRTGRLRGKA